MKASFSSGSSKVTATFTLALSESVACASLFIDVTVPEYVFPAALLVFGYPTEQQKNREKPKRAGMQYIVHENRYHRLDAEELEQMMRKGDLREGYEARMQAFCERKYNSGFAREMTRSVGKYLEQYSRDT